MNSDIEILQTQAYAQQLKQTKDKDSGMSFVCFVCCACVCHISISECWWTTDLLNITYSVLAHDFQKL